MKGRPRRKDSFFGLHFDLHTSAHDEAWGADTSEEMLERLLRDAHRPMDVTFEGVDPGWDDERLAAWAAEFDVILCCEPPDLRDRQARAFIRDYQRRLVANLKWPHRVLGSVEFARALDEPLSIKVYLCRPPDR